MPAAPTLVRTSPAYDFCMIPRIATSRSPYFMGITCTAPSTPSSGRYRICDLMHSFYSHFSPGRVGTAAQLGLGASSISLSFYDHPGANGKALACVDVPTRAHGALPRRGGSAEAACTLFGRGRLRPRAIGIPMQPFLRLAAVAPSHANRLHSHDAEDRKGRQAADVVPLH